MEELQNQQKSKIKTVYFPHELLRRVEEKLESDFTNFSAYVKKLIIEDLKKQ